ncbi:MAG TPA: membrane or secreted protein, partial [Flavobacteriaceae bacterium]|nr:membrane or secreted protein [Flavobacteriaceae bacterium]
SPFLNKEGDSCGFCGKTPDQFENCNEPEHTK